MLKKPFILLSSGLLALLCCVTTVLAVGVKPIRTELTIDPGSSATATIRVINSEDQAITVRPDLMVYARNDEEGFPIIEDLEHNDPMNIYDWIEISTEEMELAPNSEKEVSFTVRVPADAKPGGRYASILYTTVSEGSADELEAQAAVQSLILIRVTGEEIHEAQILEFTPQGEELYGDQDLLFSLKFQNDGNIHEKPSGSIVLIGEDGEQVTQVARYRHPVSGNLVTADAIPVNLKGGSVLPGSSRIFLSEWNNNIQSGTFKAQVSLDYGSDQEPIIRETEIEIDEDLELGNFMINQLEESTSFTITLVNRGNVFERLEGNIEILNEFDSVMATLELPADAEYAAPGSTTSITIPWLDKPVPRGSYTAKLLAHYGFNDTPIESEVSFESSAWHWLIITGAGLIFVLIVVVAVLLFRRKKA